MDNKIIIDYREFKKDNHTFGQEFYDYVTSNMKPIKNGYKIHLGGDHDFYFEDIIQGNLTVGDYACGNTCIELKNELHTNDYTKSMQSGRLNQQVDSLFESDYLYKYLFVIGRLPANDHYFSKIETKFIIGKDFDNTENCIEEILYKFMYNNSSITPFTTFDFPMYRPVWTFLKNVPGVGRKRAEDITKSLFHINTLEDLMKLEDKDLLTINGVGRNVADDILKYIHNDKKSNRKITKILKKIDKLEKEV